MSSIGIGRLGGAKTGREDSKAGPTFETEGIISTRAISKGMVFARGTHVHSLHYRGIKATEDQTMLEVPLRPMLGTGTSVLYA